MTLRSILTDGALLAGTAAVVLTTAMAVPGVSVAQTYQDQEQAEAACQQQQSNNAVGGAVIGGIAGAVLGSNLARGGGRTGGAVIGGVAGAAVGADVGASTTNCQPDYPPPPGYAGGPPPPGYDNGPPPPGYANGPGANCGWAQQQTTFPDGTQAQGQVQACQDQSGRWFVTSPPQ